MAIWLAVALAVAAAPPDDERLPRTLQADDDWSAAQGVLTARAGVWTGRGFNFQAVRTDSTQATSKQQAFFSASLLGGVQFYERFVVLGTYEADLASKITVQAGGAYLGWRERPKERYGKGVPDDVLLYAGVLVGRLEVHQTGFGAFDRGIGFSGGFAFGWNLGPSAMIQLYTEYRYLKFEYRRDTVSGDKSIGGNAAWIGMGFDFRF